MGVQWSSDASRPLFPGVDRPTGFPGRGNADGGGAGGQRAGELWPQQDQAGGRIRAGGERVDRRGIVGVSEPAAPPAQPTDWEVAAAFNFEVVTLTRRLCHHFFKMVLTCPSRQRMTTITTNIQTTYTRNAQWCRINLIMIAPPFPYLLMGECCTSFSGWKNAVPRRFGRLARMLDHPIAATCYRITYRQSEQMYRTLLGFSARTGSVRDLGNTVPAAEIWQAFRDLWHVLILR
jgi:hypothetical protein